MKFILFTTIFLAGCSTYSRRQCQEMDWYKEGQTAATAGFTLKQGKTHFIDKCQEDQSVAMDSLAFERGFKNGLSLVCTPEGLKALEAKGIKYQNTCGSSDEVSVDVPPREKKLRDRIEELEEENFKLKNQNSSLKEELNSLKSP